MRMRGVLGSERFRRCGLFAAALLVLGASAASAATRFLLEGGPLPGGVGNFESLQSFLCIGSSTCVSPGSDK